MRALGLTRSAFALALVAALTRTADARGPVSHPDRAPIADIRTRSIAQEQAGRTTFRQYCVPCHGEQGRGNGPAAVAFNPPPADFTDPDGLGKLTDAQVLEVITKGRGSMPAWGPILRPEQLGPLVAYLRALSRGEG